MGVGVLDAIKHFAAQNQLFKVHFRNVTNPMPEPWVETLIDNGYQDMHAVMRALREVKFDGCGDALSSADGELMELMMLNLLTNSLMHTDKGGFVRLGVSSYDGGIMLSVDDSGCGIAPEVLRDIFSRYRRTLSLSDMSEGAGLGLAIARGIAEKHGGALIIESRPGYGASVRVSLPRSVSGSGRLRAPEAGYLPAGMDLILTQLSPWLPPESCGYKYDD